MIEYLELEKVVAHTIDLLRESGLYKDNRAESCSTSDFSIGDLEEIQAHYRNQQPIRDYLESLEGDMVYYILSVMYIGRDGLEEPRAGYKTTMEWNVSVHKKNIEREHVVSQMIGKQPLISYLQKGLKIIQSL